MALARSLPLRLAVFLGCAVLARGADYTYYQTGDTRDVMPAKTEGALLLMGGGGDVDAAFRWFAQKAGGGDIVVLRASGADGYNDYLFTKIGGVDSVETILFHNRAASTNERVLDIIRRAEGLWLAGGDQSRYVSYWKGTPVAVALDAHVRAGKPLGGTSAGLAVLGEFSFSATEQGNLTSEIALLDPFDRRITIERDFLHFDLLHGVITDSHFMARARMGRSLVFLARLLADAKPNRLVGIGIDEKTALALESDGRGRVFSTSPGGRAWLMMPTEPAANLARQQPLTLQRVRVVALGPESALNLAKLDIRGAASTAEVSVNMGKLSSSP